MASFIGSCNVIGFIRLKYHPPLTRKNEKKTNNNDNKNSNTSTSSKAKGEYLYSPLFKMDKFIDNDYNDLVKNGDGECEEKMYKVLYEGFLENVVLPMVTMNRIDGESFVWARRGVKNNSNRLSLTCPLSRHHEMRNKQRSTGSMYSGECSAVLNFGTYTLSIDECNLDETIPEEMERFFE